MAFGEVARPGDGETGPGIVHMSEENNLRREQERLFLLSVHSRGTRTDAATGIDAGKTS